MTPPTRKTTKRTLPKRGLFGKIKEPAAPTAQPARKRTSKEKDERLPLRPYARLLTMLGDQLIRNERVALVELIKNAYDAGELSRLHANLKFDSRWDKSTGFRTTQVLATPILFEKYLLGVLQLINKRGGGPYSLDRKLG